MHKIDSGTVTYSCIPGVMTGTITPISQSINTVSSYKLSVTTKNSLIIGSYINIVVPSTITLTSSSCTSTTASGTCAVSGHNITLTLSSSLAASTVVEFTLNLQSANS